MLLNTFFLLQLALCAIGIDTQLMEERVNYDESDASKSGDSDRSQSQEKKNDLELLERLARHNDYDHDIGYAKLKVH